MSLTPTLERLKDERKGIDRQIERYLAKRRRGCTHPKAIRTYTGDRDGYLMRCSRCYVEEHHWAPYLMGSDTEFREVDWDEFISTRPPGELVLLEYEDE